MLQERATLATLFAAADRVREAAVARGQHPPRFILEAARIMQRHLGMTDARMQELLPPMAFWQAYLTNVLGRDTGIFTEARVRLPSSYEVMRSGVAEMAAHRQAVFVIFHMTAMPLVAALLASAVTEVYGQPGHVFVSTRNMAWLQAQTGRWVLDISQVIGADPSGLRRLVSGLRQGSITRVLILLDGPHSPGRPRTRALTSVAPTLAFRTGLLSTLLAMGIPVRPLIHSWEADALMLRWQPYLNDEQEQAISSVASLLEELLRRHPEQWVNWNAAGFRA
jgi:lauroyl/myristoyl acyltransferase